MDYLSSFKGKMQEQFMSYIGETILPFLFQKLGKQLIIR